MVSARLTKLGLMSATHGSSVLKLHGGTAHSFAVICALTHIALLLQMCMHHRLRALWVVEMPCAWSPVTCCRT